MCDYTQLCGEQTTIKMFQKKNGVIFKAEQWEVSCKFIQFLPLVFMMSREPNCLWQKNNKNVIGNQFCALVKIATKK